MTMNAILDSEAVDPGTIDGSKSDRLDNYFPRKLFLLWEQEQWSLGALDFERDRRDWLELAPARQAMLIRSIAPFFAGEGRVAEVLGPIILAADDAQEKAFLATQQADEFRHMFFFERMWREVFAPDPSTGATALDDARGRCNEAFGELFERRPLQAVERLRADPRDTGAKVEAVAIYHLVVEAMLGLTAMHFVLDYFQKNALFPAAVEGLRRVKRDEHRHVAWGTWYLRRKCREDDRYGRIVERTLSDLLPLAASVLMEGGLAGACDGLDPVEFLDYDGAAVCHFALLGLSRRLKVIGGATTEIQGFAASGAWRAARVM
jgi:ribonucleoside-diphosphate reductase beta chain